MIVRLLEALTVTDDGPLAAKGTEPGEQFQRDLSYPGSILSSVSGRAMMSGSAMKRSKLT